MRVRMITLMAGPDGVVVPGQIVDSSDAAALVAGGYAAWVDRPGPAPPSRTDLLIAEWQGAPVPPPPEIELMATTEVDEIPEPERLRRGRRVR